MASVAESEWYQPCDPLWALVVPQSRCGAHRYSVPHSMVGLLVNKFKTRYLWPEAAAQQPSEGRDTGFRRATLTGSGIHAMGLVGGHNQTPFA
jgi:hypothetical protein